MTMVAKRVTRLIAAMAEGEREFLILAAPRDTLLTKSPPASCAYAVSRRPSQAMVNVKWTATRGFSRES